MAFINIRNIGNIGFVEDVLPQELPPEVWSYVENVRFRDGYATRSLGETAVEGTPTGTPYFIFTSPSATQSFWMYTDMNDFWAVAGGTHTEITRVSGVYTGNMDDRWNGGWLNGIMVVNNGVDVPQLWNPVDAGTRLVDLTNWPASTTAKVLRPFQNMYIALDVTKTATRFSTMMKWSDIADAGAVPSTWDETDTTALSGELPVGWTPGACVDGLSLGNSFIIYKEDAIVRADRIATNDVFSLRPISLRTGIMAQECAKEYERGKHIVFTRDKDVVINDGQRASSILDRRIRSHLTKAVDGDNSQRSFLVVNYPAREVLICYPEQGETLCTQATVWNWQDNTWAVREISPTLDMKAGIYDETTAVNDWDSDPGTWDSDTTSWNESLFDVGEYKILGAFPTASAVRQIDRGHQRGTDTYSTMLERLGLAIAGQARDGSIVVDQKQVKHVTEVWPMVDSIAPITLNVSVGASDRVRGAITWEGPKVFNPETDTKLDFDIEGRFLSIRFESASPVEWKLFGYGIEVDLVGEGYAG